jgi:hypothetical protein
MLTRKDLIVNDFDDGITHIFNMARKSKCESVTVTISLTPPTNAAEGNVSDGHRDKEGGAINLLGKIFLNKLDQNIVIFNDVPYNLSTQETKFIQAILMAPHHALNKDQLKRAVGSHAFCFKPCLVFKHHPQIYDRLIHYNADLQLYELRDIKGLQ